MVWLDVSTIRFDSADWTISRSNLSREADLDVLPVLATRQKRFVKELEMRADDMIAAARLTKRDNRKAGSRTAGAVLEELFQHFSTEDLPDNVFLSCTDGSEGVIQGRLLIPFALMASISRRTRFLSNHRRLVIPSRPGMTSREYEDYARETLREDQYSEWEFLHGERLFTSKPDSIAIHRGQRRLDIIEIKKLAPDLLEGASQIMLYSEQARVLAQYAGYDVSTILVTAKPEPKPSYLRWEEYMRSVKCIRFHVRDSALESNVLRVDGF